MKEQQPNEKLIACRKKTSIGGQALMEGIMMRGPKKVAMAVRNTKGEMVIEEVEYKVAKRPAFCRWPIIRGLLGFFDSMKLGYKCLMRSAEISGLDDIVEEKPEKKKKGKKNAVQTLAEEETVPAAEENTAEAPNTEAPNTEAPNAEAPKAEGGEEDEKLPAWVTPLISVVSVVLGVALAVFLFMYLPSFLFELLAPHVGFLRGENVFANSLWKSAFEGILRIILLISYMAAVSLMKEIRRTFMYHGAEHKTIFCYEAGLELTVENVRKMNRFHPRCGTSFLILMLLVSIFVTFFIDPIAVGISGAPLPLIWRVGLKLLLLPLIVGLGFELIKFAGRHDNLLTRIISAPGVWLQHITVFEPTDDMIECAIEAVRMVIPEDDSDRW